MQKNHPNSSGLQKNLTIRLVKKLTIRALKFKKRKYNNIPNGINEKDCNLIMCVGLNMQPSIATFSQLNAAPHIIMTVLMEA